MGGHGGLNILPQKKWNVYNFDNREKVRQDEEAAALEEKLKQEQSRRRDAEFRLDRLRQACGSHNSAPSSSSTPVPDSHHINLFEGLKGFSSLAGATEGGLSSIKHAKVEAEEVGSKNGKKRKREDVPVKVQEDEKYKLGYGLIGKGVDAPWYTARPSFASEGGDGGRCLGSGGGGGSGKKAGERKNVEELREERMRREKKEREREKLLLDSMARKRDEDRGFSRRRRV